MSFQMKVFPSERAEEAKDFLKFKRKKLMKFHVTRKSTLQEHKDYEDV